MAFSAAEKQKEAEREARMRERVFATLVRKGSVTQNAADRRIAIMREIADDYRLLAEKERLL
jgi:hypothetical protein